MDELVSAVITACNRELSILERAVKSTANQTYPNIEIIVVDDSSSEAPGRKEIEEYLTSHYDLTYIRHPKTLGACAARNTGLSMAKGYYIAYLDDDDEWLPTKIERQLTGFSNNDVALTYCNLIVNDEKNHTTYEVRKKPPSSDLFTSVLRFELGLPTSIPLIRRDTLRQIGGFDTSMQSWQDHDVWLRLAKCYQFAFIPESLMIYHLHTGTRISTNPDRKLAGLTRLMEKYQAEINHDKISWWNMHRRLITIYMMKRQRKEALSIWFLIIRKCPYKLFGNIRKLCLILSGYDSPFHRLYKTIYRKGVK